MNQEVEIDLSKVFGQQMHHTSRKPTAPPNYKKVKTKATILGILAMIVIAFFAEWMMLIPINIHAMEFWMTVIFMVGVYIAIQCLMLSTGLAGYEHVVAHKGKTWRMLFHSSRKLFAIPIILFLIAMLIDFAGSEIFHAKKYASILAVQDVEFADDMAETLNSDSIALMDTKSAKRLGDREIGSLSSVVSQFNVSQEYSQIDWKHKPQKVSALEYAGFFKWLGNRANGVPGYVSVDPVSMSANYNACENGMKYVPSAYFHENAARWMWMHYPTTMMGNLHFEVDEEGNPYYIASVYKKSILLFGGTTVEGAVIMNPVTGEVVKYALEDVPTWADQVFSGYLLCDQYNWLGTLTNGYLNSVVGKKGCKQVTTYYNEGGEDDDVPQADFGYVAKDGDIWIYTGVTSVNSDSSNIGFLLANERTGEAHYYNVSGADEKSAMAAAEGEVQEKRYQASFPSLINIDGNPTYIMVLKDASGLVKLFAAVNVEQYNLVTTAPSQKECIQKYRKLLGLEDGAIVNTEPVEENEEDDIPKELIEADIVVAEIRFIDIDGNTYIYFITDQNEIYRAKVATHEELLLVHEGDTIHISHSDKDIF